MQPFRRVVDMAALDETAAGFPFEPGRFETGNAILSANNCRGEM